MNIWWLVLILAAIGSAGIAFIWLVVHLNGAKSQPTRRNISMADGVAEGVDRIFNDEFREELRNRGRLHFEKIIGENAMFLQQDLRLTTSQLNDYMKSEITRKLKEEFDKYEQSIMDAKQLAIDSIQKTNTAVDEERKLLSEQLQQEVEAAKQHLLEHFQNNTADIINHYILAAVGDQIDMNNQLEFILGNLEANKAAIIEDIKSGA